MDELKIKNGDMYINMYNTHDLLDVRMELFNPVLSFVQVNNQYFNSGVNWNRIPITSMEQMQRIRAGLADFDLGTIGWTFEGDVKMIDNVSRLKEAGIVWGVGGVGFSVVKQGSYYSFMEWLKSNKVILKSARISVITGNINAIFNAEWVMTQYNAFGQRTEPNRITPIQYFVPTTIQPNIVDIPLNWIMDGFSGIEIFLPVASSIQITFKTSIL